MSEALISKVKSLPDDDLYALYRRLVGYTSAPVDIETFITDPHYLGGMFGIATAVRQGVFPCWVKALKEIFPNPYTSPYSEVILSGSIGCFTGDTKISLLDGREVSFEDLVTEYGDNTPFWVYSWDNDKQEIVPGKAHSPRITKHVIELLEITLDNGETYRCTPDHKHMIRDGSYVRADELKINQSLMPLYRRIDEAGYEETLYNQEEWAHTHKISSWYKYGKKPDRIDPKCGNVVHHKANTEYEYYFNKRDNRPEMLELMSWFDHGKYHSEHTDKTLCRRWTDPTLIEDASKKASDNMKKLNADPEFQHKCKEGIRNSEAFKQAARKTILELNTNHPNSRPDITFDMILDLAPNITQLWEIGEKLGCSRQRIYDVLEDNGYDWKSFSKEHCPKVLSKTSAMLAKMNQLAKVSCTQCRRIFEKPISLNIHRRYCTNHKVVSIKKITLDEPVPVYDITVDDHHNFALSSGVIVHNSGKTTVAIIGCLYDLYKLSLLKDPHKLFGLISTTTIAMHIFNATLTLAEDVIWSQISEILTTSPYFKNLMELAIAQHRGGKKTLFPNKLDFTMGSRASHALGSAVFSAILDELNFQNKVGQQAYDNYNELTVRQESRFMQKGGILPGHTWLISSAATETSFIELHVKKQKDNPRTKLYEHPIWVALAHKGNYSGEVFPVFKGDDHRDPVVLLPETIGAYDADKIIQVPVEYQPKFIIDPNRCLRDLAGIATGRSGSKLFSTQLQLNNAMVLTPYFSKEVIQLDFFEDGDQLVKYFDIDRYIMRRSFAHRPRFIHIDTGQKHDKLGIACCFISDFTNVQRTDEFTLEPTNFREPIVHVEWATGIQAVPGQEIPFYKVRRFILTELVKRGVTIANVSNDGFQGVDMRQMLLKSGVSTSLLSVDKTADPYTSMRNAIYEGRCLMVRNSYLRTELIELEEQDGKVDHPMEGSKDCSDAVSGAYYSAITHKVKAVHHSKDIAMAIKEKHGNEKSIYDRINNGEMNL